ncbi:CRISPR-associated helicase Cas3' [Lactobacillus delbrueckii subsp. lactis]|nr:CRISPR-associated helicase Cas3' [Lactobacillus delbrueckii]MCD5576700.1 CRISPR-associated helicase Cas3' [Lactobacillus delbrueckii subsp. lactis]
MSDECDAFADQADGIYRLSIPTGGGKTLASLRYGLKHAIKTKKKHIIYVLPYITIIEQNAEVIRNMLNDNSKNTTNILEFHSNVSNDLTEDDTEVEKTVRLAEDNWDSPIVITTTVQFLNCIYAKSTVNRRRFHNLCDSVIIFDEVQKLPLKTISMFNKLLNFLSNIGKCNIVLCTATQPAFNNLSSGTSLKLAGKPEMISNLSSRIQQFKRVKIIDRTKKDGADHQLTVTEAAEMILEAARAQGSVLAIFNTISATERVFNEVKKGAQDYVYILTTRMCPEHRKKAIEEIKELLAEGKNVICISTALIEAGVDISFSCVFRSLCGLDSIVQSAGRCNRNAEKKYGTVNLILMDQTAEKLNSLQEIKNGKEIVQGMLDGKYKADSFLEDETINYYFQVLYRDADKEYLVSDHGYQVYLADCIDGSKLMQKYVNEYHSGPKTIEGSASETIARNFEVIDEDMVSLIAPYGLGKEIITKLNSREGSRQLKELLKVSQPYLVGVYRTKLKELIDKGAVISLGDEYQKNEIFAIRDDHYDDGIGLVENPTNNNFVSF